MNKENIKKWVIIIAIFLLVIFAHGIFVTLTNSNKSEIKEKNETVKETTIVNININDIEKSFQEFTGIKEKTSTTKQDNGYKYSSSNKNYYYCFNTDNNKKILSLEFSCYDNKNINKFAEEISTYFDNSQDIEEFIKKNAYRKENSMEINETQFIIFHHKTKEGITVQIKIN